MCFVWLIINKAFVRVELYTLILIHYVLENEYYTRIGVFFPWIDRRCMIHEELCRALQLIFDQFDSSPIHTFSNTYWSTNDNIKKNSNVSDRQVVIIVAYVINFLSAPQMDNCHFGRLQERFVNPRFRSAPCDTHHHHYIFLLACSQPLKCPDAVE